MLTLNNKGFYCIVESMEVQYKTFPVLRKEFYLYYVGSAEKTLMCMSCTKWRKPGS